MALGDAMERLRQKRLEKIKQRSMEAAEKRKARHEAAMAANQRRLEKQAASGEAFPNQVGSTVNPFAATQKWMGEMTSDNGLAARQSRVVENAKQRREERRATLAARRRARRGLG